MRHSVFCTAVLSALPALVGAHDITIWPVLSDAQLRLEVRYGHPGEYETPFLGRLVTLDLWSPSGERRPLAGRLRLDGQSIVMSPTALTPASPGTWVLAGFYDNAFALTTADGRTVNTTLNEYPTATRSVHNLNFAKALVRSGRESGGFDRVIGHRLELVPRADPFGVTPGPDTTVPIEVRFNGQPLPDVSVFAFVNPDRAETVPMISDAQGQVRVKIARRGLQILTVEHEADSPHRDVSLRNFHAASLVFVVP